MAGRGTDDSSAPWPGKPQLDDCRRCPLWEHATQGVPGEGARTASIVLVGEQPGDEEDMVGRPFVGPAGRLLRALMQEVGIDAATAYITNAVKHFKWEPRGKRRLHKTPAQREFDACRVWLEKEIATLAPRVIVALGAKALVALTGRRITIAAGRESTLLRDDGTRVIATFHPSAILRAPDPERRAELRAILRDDLQTAAKLARRDVARPAVANRRVAAR
jgi:DNA polymerase